jgi:NAD(P)-dependent dehydrogenase (short-subunit alcohol dehydrogenase family)
MTATRPLQGKVALVTGGTRGAGRAIAIELGAAGAFVYVTGRSTREQRSEMNRPESIEDTAELVREAGGDTVAVRVDHARPREVMSLAERMRADHGRLDVLVNDIWGGDPLVQWGVPFWQHDLDQGLRALRQGVETHLITTHTLAPLLLAGPDALVVEVTDGVKDDYRGSLFYDLAKAQVLRLARAEAAEFAGSGVTVVAITPGFLRSEAVLDHFGVTEATWRDAVARDRHFAASETPRFVARAITALAADPEVAQKNGCALTSSGLAQEYGFSDVDGSYPDWGAYFDANVRT